LAQFYALSPELPAYVATAFKANVTVSQHFQARWITMLSPGKKLGFSSAGLAAEKRSLRHPPA